MLAEGNYVTLVDAGDAIQGAAYGSMSQGEDIIGIMNAVGYDVAAHRQPRVRLQAVDRHHGARRQARLRLCERQLHRASPTTSPSSTPTSSSPTATYHRRLRRHLHPRHLHQDHPGLLPGRRRQLPLQLRRRGALSATSRPPSTPPSPPAPTTSSPSATWASTPRALPTAPPTSSRS